MAVASPMGTTKTGNTAVVLQSVWQSLNQGATWQNIGGQGSGPGQGLPGTIENGAFVSINNDGQARNNLAILADPTNKNIVYISGDDQPAWNQINPAPTRPTWPNQIGAGNHTASIWRGDASLALSSPPTVGNWTPTTPYNGQWLPITDNFANGNTTPHSDSRSMAFDNNGNLLETNDGGIYRLSAPQSSNGIWTSLIGNLQVTEIYGLAYDSNTHTLISANQDVGASAQNLNGNGTPSTIWTQQLGADGGSVAVNDSNPTFSVRYLSSQALSSFTRIKVDLNNNIIEEVPTTLMVGNQVLQTGPETDIPRQAPVRLNQDNQSMLAIGTNVVYLTTDDVTASSLSPVLQLTSLNTTPFANPVGDIAYGRPGNANLLLAAEGSNLWLSTTLQVGSLIQTNYPGPNTNTISGTTTSVSINPNYDNQFYVADGNTVRSTIDGGMDWTTGLSLSQLRSLQFVSNGPNNFLVAGGYGTLYAARDTDLNDWYSLTGNLPNTFVWQMAYSSSDDVLAVGTVGRGAFTLANASTLMPASPSPSDPVDTVWIRLLRANPLDQTLDGGTLQNPDSAALGMMSLTLNSLGGTFDTSGANANSYNSGTSSTINGVVSGPGSFTITGPGTLTLTGLNTYSGGTILSNGILQVSQDANLGAATGPITFNGGTLQAAGALMSSRTLDVLGSTTFDTGTFASAFSGELFGNGTLTQQGTGSLTLTGDGSPFQGTYSVNGGSFTLNNAPNTLGSILAPCSLVVNSAGTWSGNGNLVGSLNLQGDGSGFSGSVEVPSTSTFILDNTLGGSPAPCTAVVDPGGLMTGNGTLVGTLTNQGTISPSNSPGTLGVVGSFTQTANGIYLAEIASPSSYDKIAVTGAPGTANLAGTISPVLLGGYRPLGNTVFPGVVTATGGITGTFSTVLNQQIGSTLFWQPR